MKRLLYLVLILFTVSCSGFEEEENSLRNILASYDEEITKEPRIYILRARFFCGGCMQKLSLLIDSARLETQLTDITFIAYSRDLISEQTIKNSNFQLDSLNLVSKMMPSCANISVIRTCDSRVTDVVHLNDTRNIYLPKFVEAY